MDSRIVGLDWTRPVDALFVNAPLRDYSERPRINDFTLPVLGMAYIATYAAEQGFNVGVLDAESNGLGVDETAAIINNACPGWVGLNLLAPTYSLSADIAAALDPTVKLMVGGHHARALPTEILRDPRMARCQALLIGEAETRVAELLSDRENRTELPGVMWLDQGTGRIRANHAHKGQHHLTPDINEMPFVDRRYLSQDPFWTPEGWEASMVGARGCPYGCSFCGAAVSANPDVTIRTRHPENIIDEMVQLRDTYEVTRFRFVDDLFLGAHRVIKTMMDAFSAREVGTWARWDATGRINVLHREFETLDLMVNNGLREVALGIESGSDRMLAQIDKRITRDMTVETVDRLLDHGINVKGYFILGMPGETRDEMDTTVGLVHELWDRADRQSGNFRASVFEYRPYPGTPDWARLMATGKYQQEDLLAYTAVDLSEDGVHDFMRERDEFNFSVNLQLSEVSIDYIRKHLVELSAIQFERTHKTDPNNPMTENGA